MVKITYHPDFKKAIKKLDKNMKVQVKKQLIKIIKNPEIGKPMEAAAVDASHPSAPVPANVMLRVVPVRPALPNMSNSKASGPNEVFNSPTVETCSPIGPAVSAR